MAIKSNTYTTYSVTGTREDLSDVISMITPKETPFLTMIGTGPAAKQTFFEWQQDALASADGANAQLEGQDYDSAGLQAATATTRIGNYCQISSKSAIVSGTNEVTTKAGRKSEMGYQMAKRAAELKRDIETILLSNQGAAAGNSTTARKTASLLAFIKTNVSKATAGTAGVNPVYTTIPTDVRTDGTTRAFTEALLKTVQQLTYSAGGSPDTLMLGPVNKQNFSAFAGIAAQRFNVKGSAPSTVIGAADVYVGDYGNLSVVPNRLQRERDAFLLDADMISVSKLRDYRTEPLAKTGDAEKKLLLIEYGLRVENEAALGLVADLTSVIN